MFERCLTCLHNVQFFSHTGQIILLSSDEKSANFEDRKQIYCWGFCLLISDSELTKRGESLAVVAGHAGEHRGLLGQGGGDTRGIVPERRTHRALKQEQRVIGGQARNIENMGSVTSMGMIIWQTFTLGLNIRQSSP